MASVFSISIDDEDQPLVGPRSGLGAVAGSAPAFSPLDIPLLKLWLKADAGTNQTAGGSAAVADGDPVGEWLDQSGNGKHVVQATSTKRGTLKTGANGQNGRAVVRGDGVDDILASATVASAVTDNFTIFIVARSTPGAGYSCYFANGAAGGGIEYFLLDLSRIIIYDGVSGMTDTTNIYNSGTCEIVTHKREAGTGSLRVNGSAHTLATPTITPLTPLSTTTALSRSNGSPIAGDIAEILLYDAALTAPQIAQVEAYLNARWAAF